MNIKILNSVFYYFSVDLGFIYALQKNQRIKKQQMKLTGFKNC